MMTTSIILNSAHHQAVNTIVELWIYLAWLHINYSPTQHTTKLSMNILYAIHIHSCHHYPCLNCRSYTQHVTPSLSRRTPGHQAVHEYSWCYSCITTHPQLHVHEYSWCHTYPQLHHYPDLNCMLPTHHYNSQPLQKQPIVAAIL